MEGDKSTLNMSASESTPVLDDDDIDFKGFGTTQENNDDTIPLLDYVMFFNPLSLKAKSILFQTHGY